MTKNDFMVPVNVQDMVNRLSDKTVGENERANILLRLEAIRDYCSSAVYMHTVGKSNKKRK